MQGNLPLVMGQVKADVIMAKSAIKEAEGRYDVHVVVRLPQLKKCFEEVMKWYDELIDAGYK